jgi:anti-sigma regulatory factor (Ser/Thr protein kinase)
MTEIVRRSQTRPIYLMLRMKPPWVFIDEIRRFVESFCACACPNQEREAQVALAVHELMQNAVPHSREEDVDLVLEVDPNTDKVTISVSNPCTGEQFEKLRARITSMNAEPDALKHYLEAMRAAPSTRGGLGLPRVRFEAQLDVAAHHDGDRVMVVAAGKLRAPRLHLEGGVLS